MVDLHIGECCPTGGKITKNCYHECKIKYEGDQHFSPTQVRCHRDIAAILFGNSLHHPDEAHFQACEAKGYHPDQKSKGKYKKTAKAPADAAAAATAAPSVPPSRKKRKRADIGVPVVRNGIPRDIRPLPLAVPPPPPPYSFGGTMAAMWTVNVVMKCVIWPRVNRRLLQSVLGATFAEYVFPMMCTALKTPAASISHPDTGQLGLTGASTEGHATLAAHVYADTISRVFGLPFLLCNLTVVNYTVRAQVGAQIDLRKFYEDNKKLVGTPQHLKDLRFDPKLYPGLHWPIHEHFNDIAYDYDDGAEEEGEGEDGDVAQASAATGVAEVAKDASAYISQVATRSTTTARKGKGGTRSDKPHAMIFGSGTVVLVGLRSMIAVVHASDQILPILRERVGVAESESAVDPKAHTFQPWTYALFEECFS